MHFSETAPQPRFDPGFARGRRLKRGVNRARHPVTDAKIRQAGSGEVDVLLRLVRECIEGMRGRGIDQWDDVYPDRATLERDIDEATAFVAMLQGVPVGMAVLNERQEPEYADVPWLYGGRPAVIHRLMVSPAAEGTGIARALMARPGLLLLDEPATGLDIGGREQLLHSLARLCESEPALATVLVTHHLEELPASLTHALLLRDGRALAAGPAADVLTSEGLSACFNYPVTVTRHGGRWTSVAG